MQADGQTAGECAMPQRMPVKVVQRPDARAHRDAIVFG